MGLMKKSNWRKKL